MTNSIRRIHVTAAVAALVFAFAAGIGPVTAKPERAPAGNGELSAFEASDRHRQVSRKVTELMSRFHYSRAPIDNALSSAVLDRYLDTIDGQRLYLLADDVASFNRYRYELDDRVGNGDLEPVFGMFSVYRERYRDRLKFALALLDEGKLDFESEEIFRFDRSEESWPETREEQDELWRQRVTNDALTLKLADREWDEVADTLTRRYERMLERMEQLSSDDVFSTFMNAFANTMDPHTSYLSPRNQEEYQIQMSLSYEGIGASLQIED